jgi:O-antigen/teichoic acid export membrane protein
MQTETTATIEPPEVVIRPAAEEIPLERPARRRRSFFGFTARKGSTALLDQAVVSGTSFLTRVLVGRICGPHELGLYSLGFSVVIIGYAVLGSLVFTPYMVYTNRTRGRRRRIYAGAALAQTVLLALIAVPGVLLLALGLRYGNEESGLHAVLWGLTTALPFILVREFTRRFSFAHFRTVQILLLDVGVATLTLAGLLALGLVGLLSGQTAFLVIGLSCSFAVVVYLAYYRRDFRLRPASWPVAFAKNWRFGRWVLGSELVSQLNSSTFLLWLLLFTLGEAASGVFAACASITLFVNPVLLSVSHILTPRVARAFAEGGHRELRHVVARAAALLGVTTGLFCTLVLLFGGAVVKLLYGPQYAGHDMTIFVLALDVLVVAIGMAVGCGIYALDRPDLSFRAKIAAVCATFATAAVLVYPLGLLGLAMSLLVGSLCDLTVRIYCFRSLTLEPSTPAAA